MMRFVVAVGLLLVLNSTMVEAQEGLLSSRLRKNVRRVPQQVITTRTSPVQVVTPVKKKTLSEEIVGAWVLVSPKSNATRVAKRVKFFSQDQFTVTGILKENNVVRNHHGGSYEIKGDEMTTTVDYATADGTGRIGRGYRYRIEIREGKLYQYGIDNKYNEVWERMGNTRKAGE